jgi:thiamine biosynthesis lipoprotein ApbE
VTTALAVDAATWRAIGTDVHVLVAGGSVERAGQAVERTIDEADRAYSRFRPDSELQRLLARPGETIEVSATLARAVDAALRAAALSDGLVDPTVGRALRLAGYDIDFAAVAPCAAPIRVRVEAVPGWRVLAWDSTRRHLRVPPGIELDFGSTGKALIADVGAAAAYAEVRAHWPDAGVLVSIGGDIALAGRPPSGGWRVLMAEDAGTRPDEAGEVVALCEGALATSSTTVRRWQRGEAVLHHLIDPRTGLPADGPWRTVSVAAATCVDANITATAAIVMGNAALDWLATLGLAARLVANDGEIVRVGGWPAADMATDHAGPTT